MRKESQHCGRGERGRDGRALDCGEGTGRCSTDRRGGRRPQGKALDLLEAMPIEKRDVAIVGANDYSPRPTPTLL